MKKKKTPYAKKSFGQNFLIDENYVEKIISALFLEENEKVVEIGAGRGALTKGLLESGVNVVAIELDRDLIPLLQSQFAGFPNFSLIAEDALKVDFSKLFQSDQNAEIKLVANLPYYISTAILQHLLKQLKVFRQLVLMLQREVVERITAQAGDSERGFLSVLVEASAETEKLFDVPPTAFRPVPKVWSSVISLRNKKEQLKVDEIFFREVISLGFRQRRKTLTNNLKQRFSNLESLLKLAEIEGNRRAETLTLAEWENLTRVLGENNLAKKDG